MLESLYELLRKDVQWEWNSVWESAFEKSKEVLSEKAVLTVDSSAYGVGAVLSHLVDGVECPIAFESASLTSAQRNYSLLHKESFGVQKFHKYLFGRLFTIYSDEPLKILFVQNRKVPILASSR